MVSEGTRGKYLIACAPQTPNLLHLVFCSQFLQGEIKEIISELRPSTEHFTLNGNLFEKLISSWKGNRTETTFQFLHWGCSYGQNLAPATKLLWTFFSKFSQLVWVCAWSPWKTNFSYERRDSVTSPTEEPAASPVFTQLVCSEACHGYGAASRTCAWCAWWVRTCW